MHWILVTWSRIWAQTEKIIHSVVVLSLCGWSSIGVEKGLCVFWCLSIVISFLLSFPISNLHLSLAVREVLLLWGHALFELIFFKESLRRLLVNDWKWIKFYEESFSDFIILVFKELAEFSNLVHSNLLGQVEILTHNSIEEDCSLLETAIDAVGNYFRENRLENFLHLRSTLEKKLENCIKKSCTESRWIQLLHLFLHLLKYVGCLCNLLSKLAKNPNECNFTFSLLNLVHLDLWKKRDKLSDKLRILSQDVFENLYRLCCHIIDLQGKEVSQLALHILRHWWESDCNCTETLNGSFSYLCIHIGNILA